MDSADHNRGVPSIDRAVCLGVKAVTEPGDALILEGSLLRSLGSLEDLARWRDEVGSLHRHLIVGAPAVRDVANGARSSAETRMPPAAPAILEALLAAGFGRMRENAGECGRMAN